MQEQLPLATSTSPEVTPQRSPDKPAGIPDVNPAQFAVAPKLNKWAFYPGWFFGGWAAALVLFASWAFFIPTRQWWDGVDRALFFSLNGLVSEAGSAQVFWAILSSRAFDVVPAVVFFLLFFTYMRADGGKFFMHRTAQAAFTLLYALVAIFIGKLLFVFESPSPTLTLAPNNSLSALVPWAWVKDSATASFPSDHSLLYLMVAVFLWHFAGTRRGVIAAALGGFLILPRLLSGAHWGTDVFVGSFSYGLAALVTALATPLATVGVSAMEKILAHPALSPLVMRFSGNLKNTEQVV